MRDGFSIIFDVAMGGDYPNSECYCHTPTLATTSGGTMTVRYVSVFARRCSAGRQHPPPGPR